MKQNHTATDSAPIYLKLPVNLQKPWEWQEMRGRRENQGFDEQMVQHGKDLIEKVPAGEILTDKDLK